ncbi:MAG: S49 family peptidase [Gammaproteobacteria bacterium]|nr:S49 family peptidase [Gammaproteobacteria bacterium]
MNDKKDDQTQIDGDDSNVDKNSMKQEDTPVASDSLESADPWTRESSPEVKATTSSNVDELSAEGERSNNWQQDLINRLAFASLNEQRRNRRWGVFFKSLLFVYLFSLLFLFSPSETGEINLAPHTAVIEIKGVISDDQFASADNIVSGLRAAFKNKNSHGVILRINSPGGSPVQSGYVYDEIVRLRKEYPNKPLYAVVTDMAASGAYYIAAAADEIYADKASMVGSIGVITGGYGFVEAMKKLGIERRVLTAGENKAFLDPFSPLQKSHKDHMEKMLANVHEQFITAVKKGRGERIKDDSRIFSGLIWSGEQSIDLGLIDGLGSTSQVAREIIGEEKIVDYTVRPSYIDRFAERIGVTVSQMLYSVLNKGFELN